MAKKQLTNDQILWACKKRIEGCSWNDIAAELDEVADILRGKVVHRLGLMTRDEISAKQIDGIKFVGIREYINGRHSSVRAFVSAIGLIEHYSYIANALKTGKSMKFEYVEKILSATGMTFEEAFRKEASDAQT